MGYRINFVEVSVLQRRKVSYGGPWVFLKDSHFEKLCASKSGGGYHRSSSEKFCLTVRKKLKMGPFGAFEYLHVFASNCAGMLKNPVKKEIVDVFDSNSGEFVMTLRNAEAQRSHAGDEYCTC